MAVYGKMGMTEFTPLNEMLYDLLRDIEQMQKIHEKGETCCDQSEEWKTHVCGWHNSRFPPEYRQCCLNGKEFEMNASCDLYYFMSCYYEKISGCKAPYNFELVHSWKKSVLISLKDWDAAEQKAVIAMIADCTRWKKEQRIQDAGKLLQKDFMKAVVDKTDFVRNKDGIK